MHYLHFLHLICPSVDTSSVEGHFSEKLRCSVVRQVVDIT